jgi:hypothetical protein
MLDTEVQEERLGFLVQLITSLAAVAVAAIDQVTMEMCLLVTVASAAEAAVALTLMEFQATAAAQH